MHAECGQAQTEGKMCLPRLAGGPVGEWGGARGGFASMRVVPYLSAPQNEAPATSDIVTRDMSIDQWARDFNDSLNSFY